jgi:hypothetical protein
MKIAILLCSMTNCSDLILVISMQDLLYKEVTGFGHKYARLTDVSAECISPIMKA